MSTGWITDERLFNYGGAVALSPESLVTIDVSIMKTFPAVEFIGTEFGGLFQEIREIGGDWWFATNATFEPAAPAVANQWTQVNNTVASYATVHRANGLVQRLSAPVGSPAPLPWVTLWTMDANGLITSTPATATTAATNLTLNPTWNAPGFTMRGIRVNVTDTASAASSLLEDLQVGNASMWSVRKDGTLVAGSVPTTAVVNINGLFVALSPSAQQTGFINVSGLISAAGSIQTSAMFSTTTAVGNAVLSYRNNAGGSNTTILGSFGTSSISGIAGTTLLVSAIGVNDMLALDATGNLGLLGGVNAASFSSLTGGFNAAGFQMPGAATTVYGSIGGNATILMGSSGTGLSLVNSTNSAYMPIFASAFLAQTLINPGSLGAAFGAIAGDAAILIGSSGTGLKVVNNTNGAFMPVTATTYVAQDIRDPGALGAGYGALTGNPFVIVGASGTGMSVVNHINSGFMPIAASAFNVNSDRKFKKNIKTLKRGLETIKRLRPVEYDYRSNGAHNEGFIAQEVQRVLPFSVKTSHLGLTLSSDAIIAELVCAVQQIEKRLKAA